MRLLIFLSLMTTTSMLANALYAQKIEINYKRLNPYSYQDQSYVFSELGDIIFPNEVAYDFYLKAEKSRKASKAWAIATGFIFLGGAALMAIANDSEDALEIQLGIGILTFLTGGITGIIALYQLSEVTYSRQQAINIYNEDAPLELKTEYQALKMGIISNGVGLVYVF